MNPKNFRVYYQINNQQYHIDFSISGQIDNETKSISAWSKIKERHPNVSQDEVSNIIIEDLLVW